MKSRRRTGGVFRLLLLIFILFVIFICIRAAAGKFFSNREETNTAEQTVSSDSASSEPVASSDTAPSVSSAAEEQTAAQQMPSDTNGPDAGTGLALSAEEGSSSAAAEEAEPAYDHAATELENGQAYLTSLEERTPVEMEYLIEEAKKEYEKEVRREQYQKKRDAYLNTLKGPALWEAFDDFVFLGDSRVVGFDVFGFLPPERVLAEAGDTINSITDRMDTIKAFSPKYIFISYGINDIGMGYWPTKEEYAAAFEEKIHALQKELPDAEIYVNSIIPAREDAEQQYPIWQGLPEYSEAVRQMCEKEKISFINNEKLLQEHGDLYASDGVHMLSDFYRYWAENQLLGVFDHKNGVLTF